MKNLLLKIRRFLLATFVPEFIWPVSVEINGTVIPIRNEPFSFGTKWLLKKKEYENAEIELVNEVVKEGDNVLEMGTSVGVLTRVISKLIGDTGRVLSVECNKSLFENCKRWSSYHPNVHLIYGYGFPVYKAPNNLSIDGYSDDLGSLGTKIDFSISTVEMVKNDKIIDIKSIEVKYSFQPEILVIDVEGSEEIILSNEFSLPNYVKAIIIELHNGIYKNTYTTEAQIIYAIEQAGFNLEKNIATSYLFKRL